MTARRRTGSSNRRAALLTLAAAGALLAGCTLGPSERPPLATSGPPPSTSTATVPPTTPIGPGGPGRQADPISWEPCNDVDTVDRQSGLRFTVDCAAVLVNRTGVSFTDQSIHVARARGAGVAEVAPTVVVLSGPPGANGRDRVAAVAAGLSKAVREHFAVLTVDLAGTGLSAPIDCLSGYDTAALTSLGADPAAPGAATAIAELSRSLTFECGDLAGPELSLVNSTTAADDLDALRAALGQQTLSLIGQGFGATLGAVYADRYPGRVGAAVLDAPTDPLDDMDVTATDIAGAAERALDDFAARCPSLPGGCPLGDDPRARIVEAIGTLDARPGSGPGAGRTNGGSVLLTMLLTLGDPDRWPALADAVAAAADGAPAPIGALLESALGLQQRPGWLTAAIIYGCNDGALRISPDQLSTAVEAARATAPVFGPYTVGLTGLCSSWPAAETALGAVKAAGAAPILVAGSVRDPLAPYEQVRSLAGQLASATLISWQSGRHGSYPASACVSAAVDAYLLKQQLPGVGTLCPP